MARYSDEDAGYEDDFELDGEELDGETIEATAQV
jgi:hypothetical protein